MHTRGITSMSAAKRRLIAGVLISAVAALGCNRVGCLEVTDTTALLEAPYPLDYPSTAPMPNKTLRELSRERLDLIERIYGRGLYDVSRQGRGRLDWLRGLERFGA